VFITIFTFVFQFYSLLKTTFLLYLVSRFMSTIYLYFYNFY